MKTNVKQSLDYIFRFIFGAVFIFSGFVKAVDPMGTAYKIEEYMSVFGFASWVESCQWIALLSAIVLCCMEFLIGVTIFLHIYNKVNRWVALAFMLFFTVTTLVDALTNNVSDCGCFGDAVKLTNWQTFFKNIVLDLVLVGIFVCDKKESQNFKAKKNWITLLVFAVLVIGFCIRNIMYEPCIDFRPWKVGNKMAPTIDEQQPVVSYATYKNNSTGKQKEFSMDSLMIANQEDTNFSLHWTFINSRFVNPNEIKADGFSLMAFGSSEDKSLEILSDTTADLYIIAIVNLDKASDKGMKKVQQFAKHKASKGDNVIFITSSSPTKWYNFIEKYNLQDFMFYSCDDKAIEAMARTNPSIVHISKTIVKEKFSWRNL